MTRVVTMYGPAALHTPPEGLHALRMKIGTNPPPPKLLREGRNPGIWQVHAVGAHTTSNCVGNSGADPFVWGKFTPQK